MTDNRPDLNDPRLTHYALGEADAQTARDVEQLMNESDEVRAAIEEIRAMADRLAEQFRSEPAAALTVEQREAVERTVVGDRETTVRTMPVVTNVGPSPMRRSGWAGTAAVVCSLAALIVAFVIVPGTNEPGEVANYVGDEEMVVAELDVVAMQESLSELSAADFSRDKAYRGFALGSGNDDGATPADNMSVVDGFNSRQIVRLEQVESAGQVAQRELKQAEVTELKKQVLKQVRRKEALAGEQKQLAAIVRAGKADGPVKVYANPVVPSEGLSASTSAPNRNVGLQPVNPTPGFDAPTDAKQAPVRRSVDFGMESRRRFAGTGATRERMRLQIKSLADKAAENAPAAGKAPSPRPAEPLTAWMAPGPAGAKGAKSSDTRDYFFRQVPERRAAEQQLARRARGLISADRGRDRLSNGLSLQKVPAVQDEAESNEAYSIIVENDFIPAVGENARSTFSIDVDTASYSNVRRFLNGDQWPPQNAVRLEELVNAFAYDYPEPEGEHPFSVNTEIAPCPWNTDHRIVSIGLRGREIDRSQRPPSNLVFLLDVSGSMRDPNKLPLVKSSLELLVGEMTEDDRISIVTYSGTAGTVLPSTSGADKDTILAAIQGLNAGGSTNGEGGIQLAYASAVSYQIDDGANRVILCTDGDFNVGVSDDGELVKLITEKAKSGVFLSVFGFGMGNLKDAKLEKLADNGNGQYAYVDGLREARRVFVEELAGTLYTIAKDVKLQVEFNPAKVQAYRLLGYENRMLTAPDFNNDAKDAGEIGAGHRVTALYQVVPVGVPAQPGVSPLKYQPKQAAVASDSPELLTVNLRYKQPDQERSTLIEHPVLDSDGNRRQLSDNLAWSSALAAFGMVLRDSSHKGQATLELTNELALGAIGEDPAGRRRELIDLVYKARAIKAREDGQPAPEYPQLDLKQAQQRASCDGKYSKLLKKIAVPDDLQQYGPFADHGKWDGTSYADETNLPQGYWVYVYPHWYIWEKSAE